MSTNEPIATIDTRFSAPGANPSPWSDAVRELEQAQTFWLSTVRSDLRPHVTTVLSVWSAGALWFCTGSDEQKAKNLAQNAHCAITTGCNELGAGLDIVIEGDASRVTDEETLKAIAEIYESKFGPVWHFGVHDGAFFGGGGEAYVYAVAPVVVFGFRKGDFAQTRWQFS